jgi:hypothetical protein
MDTALREEKDFNGGWSFGNAGGCERASKCFTLPPSAVGQSVFLDIEEVKGSIEVYLNGMRVGGENAGQTSYRINLTPAINKPGVENRMEILGGRSLYGSLRLVRTAPVHVGHKGVSISTKIMPDGSAKVFANVKVKGPLPFVKSISPVPEAWGGDVRIKNCVLGEDGMVIKHPKASSLQTPFPCKLETKLFYVGRVVDVVTNSFAVPIR